MKINWKVRLRQKPFLVASFSALLIFVQTAGALFGFHLSDAFGAKITDAFNTLLSLLVILGVVIDPTTKGINDSEQVKQYTEPK